MDYEIEDFEIEDNIDLEDFEVDVDYEKDHNKLINRDLEDQHPISAITGLEEALANAGHQIYIGDTEPTDPNILIWIDTSGDTPITDIQLITSDNKEFITANNEKFILKEV